MIDGAGMAGKAPIQFYFDFISPFGYFATLRIDDIGARYGRETEWNSMLLGISVMKTMGLPPIAELPMKGEYILRDAERYARLHNVPIKLRVADISPLPAARAFNWLKERDPELAKSVARDLLHAYWADERDISDPGIIADIATAHGVQREELQNALRSDHAKALLQTAVEDSLEKGVFGSPFVIIDGEPFFGAEKLELVEEWLRRDGW